MGQAENGVQPVGRINEIAVDLVRYDRHAVPVRQLRHLQQLLPRPDPSHRVVGVAQKEHGNPGAEALLHVFQIHVPAVLRLPQAVPPQAEAVYLRRLIERPVNGRLHHDLTPRAGEGAGAGEQAVHHAVAVQDPVFLRLYAVTALQPPQLRPFFLRSDKGIAEDRMLRPFGQRLTDRRKRGEVHIRHPHGQHVFPAEGILPVVPLQAMGAGAIHTIFQISAVFCVQQFHFQTYYYGIASRSKTFKSHW